ncbi:MAG: hypothetical protein QOI98_1418 [Solirubrobacteraceae bacterium]|jgi:methionine-rich copper-binding protein CopC|nr:hypothetical protein [Solirubrobacteraceae bacterium]
MTTRRRLLPRVLAVLSIAAVACIGVGVASALDTAKPAPDCHGALVEDGKADGVDGFAVPFRTSDSLEIQRTFFKYDPAKGAEGLTLNMVVKNLSLTVPAGATGLIWDFKFLGADAATHFVRAVLDYTGGSVFEYGTLDDSLPVQRYVPEGDTPGKFFDGPDGVVQLVVPPDFAKAGSTIKAVIGEAQMAFQVVPGAIRTPTRGLSNVYDDTAGKTIAVAECTPEQIAGPGALNPKALPVSLTTKSATAKKVNKAKSLSLNLKSSEALTNLTAKLLKGKTTVGKGSLRQLSGSGTLKLKLSKKLKKGSYTLNLAGSDASGAKLTATAVFKVK